jgi:hypothetical protein
LIALSFLEEVKIKLFRGNFMKKEIHKGLCGGTIAVLTVPLAIAPWISVVSANSSNYVDKILRVKNNDTLTGSNNLYIAEDDIDFGTTTSDTFRVTLPSGTEWNFGSSSFTLDGGTDNAAEVKVVGEQIVEIRPKAGAFTEKGQNNKIKLPLQVKLNGASGELKLKIESMDSTVTSGEYTFATTGSVSTTATVNEVKNIGETGDGGTIRIEENYIGSISAGATNQIKLRLPSNFKWDGMTTNDITFGGGFSGKASIVGTPAISDNELTIIYNLTSKSTGSRGYVYIKPHIKADSNAAKGDVTVNITGTDISDNDIVVAEYFDWGGIVKVEQVNQILASKFDDKKVVKMTIEETSPGAFIGGREVEVELPDAVKIPGTVNPLTGIIVSPSINYSGSDVTGTVNAERNTVTFAIPTTPSSSKRKLVFEAALAVKTGVYGDIKATVQGAGIEKQEVVIAKSIPPGIPKPLAEGKLKIGLQGQAIPDIILAETVKGAVKQSVDLGVAGKQQGYVLVYFSRGVTFTGTPKIKVIEGDLLIDSVQVIQAKDLSKAPTDMYEGLKIDIKGESTKPSKIQISDIKLSVDRSVPEGILEAKIAGSAVAHPYNSLLFNITSGIPFKVADVITPAPSETNLTGSFVIGSTTYKIGDVEKTMDAAPYIKNDRTYLPVRYVAEVMGINEDNIVWDKASQTVSLFKRNKVVQIKMGVKKITVNGADITTDVAPEIKNERMMLPIAHVAQALGSKARWDAESKTVYIE